MELQNGTSYFDCSTDRPGNRSTSAFPWSRLSGAAGTSARNTGNALHSTAKARGIYCTAGAFRSLDQYIVFTLLFDDSLNGLCCIRLLHFCGGKRTQYHRNPFAYAVESPANLPGKTGVLLIPVVCDHGNRVWCLYNCGFRETLCWGFHSF